MTLDESPDPHPMSADQKRTRRVHRLKHEEVQRARRQLRLDLVVLRRVPPRLADVVVRVRVAAASILRPRDPGSRARPVMRPSPLTHGGRSAQCRLNLLETRKTRPDMTFFLSLLLGESAAHCPHARQRSGLRLSRFNS